MSNAADQAVDPASWRITRFDIGFGVLLGLWSMLYFLGTWGGSVPFVFLGGDTANIASFAAGIWYPENFVTDPVLGDYDNFRIYMVVHILALEPLRLLTGDYGTAFMVLLGPHLFIQGLGFYILGNVVFHARWWAALLSVCSLATVPIESLGEYWGSWPQVQPRLSFQAILPFLLVLAIAWRSRPERWSWLMAGAGLLVYVHSVSAPALGFALWLGLWICHPPTWSLTKRITTMLRLGAVFLAVITPFTLNYVGHFEHGSTTDFVATIGLLKTIYAPGYLELPTTIRIVASQMASNGLLLGALAGDLVAFLLLPADRKVIALANVWLVGFLTVSTVVPTAEHAVSMSLQRLPLQLDLVRSVRYAVPLLLLLVLWVGVAASARLPRLSVRGLIGAIGLAVTLYWVARYPPRGADREIRCLTAGRVLCGDAIHDRNLIEALEAVRRWTEPQASILPTFRADALRYASHRSVVYIDKDRGILGYSNHEALRTWLGKDELMAAMLEEREPHILTKRLVDQGGKWGADYLFVESRFELDRQTLRDLNAETMYENTSYKLVKLNDHPLRWNRINPDPAPVVGVCQENGAIKLYRRDADGRAHVIGAASKRSIRKSAVAAENGLVTIVRNGTIELSAPSIDRLELTGAGGYAYSFSTDRCARKDP
jgi:hypothetical protein